MPLVGRSYIEFDADLTAALSKINQLERRANEAKQAMASPVSVGGGGNDQAIASFEQMQAELAKVDTLTAAVTVKTNEQALAEARLAAAVGDHSHAIEILEAQITAENADTVEGIRLSTQITVLENQQTAALRRQADERVRIAAADARALAVKKDYAGALQTVRAAQETETAASAGALSQLTAQAAQYEVAGTAAGAFGAHVGAMLNPLMLATAAIGASIAVAKSFGDALHFAGELQEERTAFGGILGDFKNGNAILDEAIARSRAYGFTQKETTDAFRELAPIIRESTSSTKDQTEALARISVLKPDKPVQALASAIEGIKTGRFRELSKELGLTATEQANLKAQVDGGKDAFIALNDILDRHGITLQVAKERTEGLVGAERQAQQAEEDLQKAQADFAQGPGVAFVQSKTIAYKAFIDLLNTPGARNPLGFGGAFGKELVDFAFGTDQATDATNANTSANAQNAAGVQQSASAYNAAVAGANAAGNAIQEAGAKAAFAAQAMQLSAQASTVDAAAKEAQQAKTALVGFETDQAATAFLKLNPNLDASQAFAAAAAAGLGPLVAQVIALRIEANNTRAALLGEKLDAQTARELTGAGSDRAEIEAGKHAGVVAGRARGQAEAAATADAMRQAQAAQGNLGPSLEHAQAVLNQLAKDGKQNTAQYIHAQEEVRRLQDQQAQQGQKTLDSQIALAKATGDTATARRLLNQELADAKARGDVDAQAKAIQALKDLDKAGRTGGKGISTLDRTELTLISDKRDRLAEINKQLKEGNLTQLQHNQLLIEARKLEADISKENEKQADAALSARLSELQRTQQLREDKPRLAFLDRLAQAGGDRGQRAADAAEIIRIQEEQGARSLNKQVAEAGGVVAQLGTVPTTSAGTTGAPAQGAGGAAQAGAGLSIGTFTNTLLIGEDVLAAAIQHNVTNNSRAALRTNKATG